MMKRLVFIVLILLPLVSCGKVEKMNQSTPQEAVLSFFAYKKGQPLLHDKTEDQFFSKSLQEKREGDYNAYKNKNWELEFGDSKEDKEGRAYVIVKCAQGYRYNVEAEHLLNPEKNLFKITLVKEEDKWVIDGINGECLNPMDDHKSCKYCNGTKWVEVFYYRRMP